MNRLSILTCALLSAGLLHAAAVDLNKLPPASARTDVTFEKDILPLFKDSCVRCHGAERPKAGLRLDSAEAAVKGSKNGKVIVPGDSAKSDLVIAIAQLDPETAMPPKRQNRPNRPQNPPAGGAQDAKPRTEAPAKPLTAEQIGLVRAWIDQGAK